MAAYSYEKCYEMVLLYSECGRTAAEALRLYVQNLPVGPHSTSLTIAYADEWLRMTGIVSSHPRYDRTVSATREYFFYSTDTLVICGLWLTLILCAENHTRTLCASVPCHNNIWQLAGNNHRRLDWDNYVLTIKQSIHSLVHLVDQGVSIHTFQSTKNTEHTLLVTCERIFRTCNEAPGAMV